MKISGLLLIASSTQALEESIEGCGHYHTQCVAGDLDNDSHYKRYDYPLSVNFYQITSQAHDIVFTAFYNLIYQKAIDQYLASPTITDRTVAMNLVDQRIATDAAFNATMNAQASALSFSGEQLSNHGCWCAKMNPNVDRELGGAPTDMVDWACKYYIERAECLLLPGGECENYNLRRADNPEDWRLVGPDGTEYKEYWARLWVGSVGALVPEEKVYIELNEDPCLKAKAKVAYNFVRYMVQQVRGGGTEEGVAGIYTATNPWQPQWDGWKPNAVCRPNADAGAGANATPHTKRCVGFTPNIVAIREPST